ncbi:MAG: hypothetical protein DMF62_16425 [Acidobacteria bacterium]|nr:MAG: hypothetical protein DMF62_16425 [Acidobacteriota bacterium]
MFFVFAIVIAKHLPFRGVLVSRGEFTKLLHLTLPNFGFWVTNIKAKLSLRPIIKERIPNPQYRGWLYRTARLFIGSA